MNSGAPHLSIVIPTLNERDQLEATLDRLKGALSEIGDVACEILLVDGGSDADAQEKLRRFADRIGRAELLAAPTGRAAQMNAGARRARSPWLFFLHADTHVSPEALLALRDRLAGDRQTVYAFTLRFRSGLDFFRRLERAVDWRSRRLGLPFGDQGMVVHRELFDALGGFDERAEAEDLDFILRAKRVGRVEILSETVATSTRQWECMGLFWATAYNVSRMCVFVALHFLRGKRRRNGKRENEK